MYVTMTDIARRLRTAQSTVSRVLNGKDRGRVSPRMAEQIRNAARDMGYQVNLAAVGLRTMKSFTIGILLPSPLDSSVGKLVADLQHQISRTSYTANFAFWETMAGAEASAKNMLSKRVDAIITCEPEFLPDDVGVPVVSYVSFDKRFDFVGFDGEESLCLCLDHLWELGHRDIDYAGGFNRIRANGKLRKMIARRGLPPLPEWKTTTSNVFEANWRTNLQQSFERMWSRARRPTAILAQNDATAIEILRKAWELGIRVPGELSVIGMGNIPMAGSCTPGLTTVDNFAEIPVAEIILAHLFDRLANPELPLRKYLARPKLIKRESCAPPRP